MGPPSTRGRRISILVLGHVPGLADKLEGLPRPFRFKVTNSVTLETLPDTPVAMYDLIAMPSLLGIDGIKSVLESTRLTPLPVVVIGHKLPESVIFVHKGAQDYVSPVSHDLPYRLLSAIERFRFGGYPDSDDTGEFMAITERLALSVGRLLGEDDDVSSGGSQSLTS